jgi:hypothetical protein
MHIGMPVTIARAAMGAILNSSVAFEQCIVSMIYHRPRNAAIGTKYGFISLMVKINRHMAPKCPELFM